MSERCKKCGAELFAGQQFCRSCGTPTGVTAGGGELPTQILQPGQASGAPATTARLSGSDTDDVSRQTSFYTSDTQHVASTSALPRPKRKARGWILAFVIIGLMGATTLVSLIAGLSQRRHQPVKVIKINKPPVAPRPPSVTRAVRQVHAEAATLGEDDADADVDVSDDKTVITKTYELGDSPTVQLNTNGKIHIEGWDEETVEVTITKRGGTEQERKAARITEEHDEERLSLKSTTPVDAPVELRYEIKLPRVVRELGITSESAQLEMSGVRGGSVALDMKKGEVELENVGGMVSTKVIKGTTKIVLNELPGGSREPNNFSVVKGEVELQISSRMNVDLKGEVVDGEIKVDDGFGFKPEKRPVGQHVVGRIGAGGKPVVVKVVNGNIKVRQ